METVQLKNDLLDLVKEWKNVIIRKQKYEEASICRDLEGILIDENSNLSEYTLRKIFNIITTIITPHMEKTANKQLDFTDVKNQISKWLKNYAVNAKQNGYIIGVSGGIDSAVCSTLCAMTGLPLTVVRMSIHQAVDQADRGAKHINWLQNNFSNVRTLDIDLTDVYDKQIELLKSSGACNGISEDNIFLISANTRSRLRMTTLYGIGGAHKLLVCGTGNKVEDFGVGFFTKFGDGGVDLSPIGELLKSEVYALGKELGIIQEILDARPTDGLWDDGRTDEDQIGATYDELEWALNFCYNCSESNVNNFVYGNESAYFAPLDDRKKEVIKIYWKRHCANAHKMAMPPVCELSNLRQ